MTTMLFTINQTVAPTRRESRNGQDFLVVPVVGIRQGVLNDEFVPLEEIAHGFEAWNGRPVTLGHPEMDGEGVSANTLEMLDQFQIGRLFNTAMRDGALVPEMWIDLSKAKLVDGGAQAVEQFEAGVMTEISTAYLRDLDETPGKFEGAEYVGVARNIKPDHLAILLDSEGACSIADGCGAPRMNRAASADGVMIALMLPKSLSTALVIDGGEAARELHVTLASLGREEGIDKDKLLSTVSDFAGLHDEIAGATNGIGRFSNKNSDGEQSFYLNFDSRQLPEFRQELIRTLKENGFDLESDHGFTPHITLAYLDPDTTIPFDNVDETKIKFDELSVVVGSERVDFDLRKVVNMQLFNWCGVTFNIRSEARRPTFTGTTEAPWEGPTIADFVAAMPEDIEPDGNQVADMSQEAKAWIASHSLLGDASAEDERNLVFFPVVTPSGDLSAGALRAVLSGRGSQADIPQAAKESAQSVARSLLDSQFGDSDPPAAAARAGQAQNESWLMRTVRLIANKLNLTEVTMNKDELVKLLLESDLGFNEEELDGMAQSALEKLAAMLNADDDGDEDGEETPPEMLEDKEEATPTANEEAMRCANEKVEALLARVDKLELDRTLTVNAERMPLVEAIVANSSMTAEQLAALDVPMLEALRQATVPADYSGQGGGPVANSGEREIELPPMF